MNEWTKERLEEMFGNDKLSQLAFLSGCHKHRFSNDKSITDGWIIPDEVLAKFAESIVQECLQQCEKIRDGAAVQKESEFLTQDGKMLYEGVYGGANNCGFAIHQHFRVKE